jgi:hypothetical protein
MRQKPSRGTVSRAADVHETPVVKGVFRVVHNSVPTWGKILALPFLSSPGNIPDP